METQEGSRKLLLKQGVFNSTGTPLKFCIISSKFTLKKVWTQGSQAHLVGQGNAAWMDSFNVRTFTDSKGLLESGNGQNAIL